MVNPNQGHHSLKRKLSVFEKANCSNQNTGLNSNSLIEVDKIFKRPRTFPAEHSFIQHSECKSSLSLEVLGPIPFESTKLNKRSNCFNEAEQELFDHNSNIQESFSQSPIPGDQNSKELLFDLPVNFVAVKSNLILDGIRNLKSTDGAFLHVSYHLNEIVSDIKSFASFSLKTTQEKIRSYSASNLKINDLIEERDRCIMKIQSLDHLLQEKQILIDKKDSEIGKLKIQLATKTISLDQVHRWVEEQKSFKNHILQKNCGYNERLPPDVC